MAVVERLMFHCYREMAVSGGWTVLCCETNRSVIKLYLTVYRKLLNVIKIGFFAPFRDCSEVKLSNVLRFGQFHCRIFTRYLILVCLVLILCSIAVI